MTTTTRRALILAGILALSALLAFPLRNATYQMVIVPLAYILWLAGLFYHSLPQFLWWIIIVLLILFMFVKSILPEMEFSKRRDQPPTPPRGEVEQLATWMTKSETGPYNRWLVANRLGKLAFQILVQRETGKQRSVFAPLTGPGWNATPELTKYLQAGLQGSFADYPTRRSLLASPVKTPLEHDIREAVEFLETKFDHRSDGTL